MTEDVLGVPSVRWMGLAPSRAFAFRRAISASTSFGSLLLDNLGLRVGGLGLVYLDRWISNDSHMDLPVTAA